MQEIKDEEIKSFYDSHEDIWPEGDNWHQYTKNQLIKYVNKYMNKIRANTSFKVLNAGSGGSTYDLDQEMYHLDLTDKHISKFINHAVGSVENIPYEENMFDVVICVGSVLNYCNASTCVREFSKVVSTKGYLILEFESSWSMEFYKTPIHKKNVGMAITKYFDSEHKLWVYSNQYIQTLLKEHNFKIINSRRFHILSSFAYRLFKNENKAAPYAKLDPLFRFIPFFSRKSHNVILLCQKN
ncbi:MULTISPECIES: methyltransferase domain-containing protein [Paenibacillus]|uniref:methyltransferase domain-containing protein n=1 Tax=Paenibacillus TaxID=44249 RepID=UPI0025A01DC5|nr:methyltransferase domain-containing protein [Paenibacillus sp. PK1-4R]WJM10687.1 methyltransferase domain-containing protein [Paenibacillus sp. PK1-4R]